MKKSIISASVCTLFAAMLFSCATVQVTTDYDHSKDFTVLKTYAIYQNPKAAKTVSELNIDRILNGVRSTLAAKGYTESQTPDFWVNINAVVKNEKSLSATTDFYGYGGMYRPYGYWGGGMGMGSAYTQFNVDNYKDGSIIIDMIDAKANKLFWEGIGNSEIDGQINDPDQKVADAINKILSTFPNAGLQPAAKK